MRRRPGAMGAMATGYAAARPQDALHARTSAQRRHSDVRQNEVANSKRSRNRETAQCVSVSLVDAEPGVDRPPLPRVPSAE